MTLNPLVSLIGRFVAYTARIVTHTHTDRQTKYSNPRCACAPRVNDNMTSILYSHHSGVAPRGAWPAGLYSDFLYCGRARTCGLREQTTTGNLYTLPQQQLGLSEKGKSDPFSGAAMGANVSTRSPTSDSQEYSSADALEPIGNTIRAASVMHCWDHQT